MPEGHFDALASDYDRLRTGGDQWIAFSRRTLEALGPARRVLDAGCGTGRFTVFAAEELGARVWGIDPSAEMLEQARRRPGAERVGFRQASLESLPFKDGWFDATHMHLVVHLVADRSAAFAQLARVTAPGGRIAIATFHLEHFHAFYLNAYFPSIPAIDIARFPDPAVIATELEVAGYGDVQVEGVTDAVSSSSSDVLERVRGRYISTLSLIPDDEYRAGLAALERDIAAGRETFTYSLHWALITARMPAANAVAPPLAG
jgi:SAM-dependent methyltransferase